MGRVRYRHFPRAIIQEGKSKLSKESALLTTIPRGIVRGWQLKAGEIVEFVFMIEGYDSFIKIRK